MEDAMEKRGMLVLTRLAGERFVIDANGTEIIIEVVEAKLSRAKIGFVAPPEVRVWREELLQAKGGSK